MKRHITARGWGLALAAAAMLIAGAPPSAHAAGDAPAEPSGFVATRIEGVRGGVIYGVDVQPDTHRVYIASETMRGGFFGASHDPANGTWVSDDMGGSWRRIGPGGSNVKVSHRDPDVVYANDRFGVYKTTDGGETWRTILPGGEGYRLGYRGLEIGKSDHDVVYAGGRGYLRVSRDGGETWVDRQLPEKDGHVAWTQVIQAHPEDPETAFFAFYDGKGPQGVWKTTDAGETWTQLHAGSARAMAIAPSDPDVIYCSSAVTHDGGQTWRPVEAMPLVAWMITVHPGDPDVAYYSRPGWPVYGTIDGGKLFHQIQGVLANYDGTEVEGMAIDAEHDVLWVGGDRIWKGEGAGAGRVRLEPTNNGFHVLSMSHITSVPTGVWATSDAQGIHYTTDGHTWRTTAMGMHGRDALWHVAPSPSHPEILFAGHERRLFKSVDAGKTWFMTHDEWYPYCIVDPVDPDVVYFSSHRAQGVMMRSTNGGRSFENLGKGRFLALRPGSPETIYIEREDGFYVSHDRAETSEKISEEPIGGFFISAGDPDLMLSARGEDGLYRSTDAGKTWHKLTLELSASTRMAESGDGALWLSDSAAGLLRSTDGGERWQQVWDAHGAVAADPWDGRSIYMTARGGIFHVHPDGAGRAERFAEPPADHNEHKVIEIDGPRFLDRSNTTYRLTRDIEMFGIARSLAMFPRGVKNITLDGGGHTVRYTRGSTIFGDDLENITIENVRFVPDDDGTPPEEIIHLTNSRGVTIRNCTFTIEGPGRLGSGKAINTAGILTDDVVIERCTFEAPDLRGYVVWGTGRHTIRHCTFRPGGNAVQLRYADGSVIEHNDFGGGKVRLRASDPVRLGENVFADRDRDLVREP